MNVLAKTISALGYDFILFFILWKDFSLHWIVSIVISTLTIGIIWWIHEYIRRPAQ